MGTARLADGSRFPFRRGGELAYRQHASVSRLTNDCAFTKMQGLGNDFVVVDATRAPFALTPAQIRALADRRFGVGCDQVLVVEPPTRADVDFRYRIFNADGGEVEQCGNGARCFVVFVARPRPHRQARDPRRDAGGRHRSARSTTTAR